MKPVDWEQLDRFADRHQAAAILGLATAALFGVERILGGLPAPDPELRQLLLRAALRAAVLRRQALGESGDIPGVGRGAP